MRPGICFSILGYGSTQVYARWLTDLLTNWARDLKFTPRDATP